MTSTNTYAPSREDFAALLDESYGQNEALEGAVIKGTVVAIEKDVAIIEEATKREAAEIQSALSRQLEEMSREIAIINKEAERERTDIGRFLAREQAERDREIALAANTLLSVVRRGFGLPYWSLSAYLKYRVKRAVSYIGNFEERLASAARSAGAGGVICGHIHHAAMHDDFGVRYMNTGDWVESCTALVEHFDGTFEIIHWTDELRRMTNTEVVTELPRREGAAKASAA